MKYIISVDAEGLACVVGAPGGTLDDAKSNYALASKQGAREADAAARALFDSGASEVVVIDAHGSGVNYDYDLIDKRCDIQLGSGGAIRLPAVTEGSSGFLLVGYHAMDNTPDAVIAHSYTSMTYQSIKINGQEVGEIAMDSAYAGARGVPTIFVASDDKGCAEARKFLPWVETVETKKSLGYNMAISKHPLRVLDDIYAGVKRAAARRKDAKPFTFASPVTMEIRYKRIEGAEKRSRDHAGWERVDAYTIRKSAERLDDLY
jgi:D-amino peptidase